jgi:alpha-beta hydrolase superfamily lysophospholipase
MRIACARWDSRGPVRGVVQIAHGMGEHIAWYTETIEFLVSNGLTVYGNDHREHGRTALSAAQFGDFGEAGFDLLVRDMTDLNHLARRENPDVPLILLGHSTGSFAAQPFVLDNSADIDGLVLSGSGALDGLAHLASSGPAGKNILDARFQPERSPFDWLSRVDAFISDPLCFAELRPAASASFLRAATRLCDPANLRNVRDDLPIRNLKESKHSSIAITRWASDISHDFYASGRHEMLNEINRKEMRALLLASITAVIERQKGFDGSSDTMEL